MGSEVRCLRNETKVCDERVCEEEIFKRTLQSWCVTWNEQEPNDRQVRGICKPLEENDRIAGRESEDLNSCNFLDDRNVSHRVISREP